MRQPTDDKIRQAAYSLTFAQGGGVTEYANMEQAIRETLAAETPEPEQPAKRWLTLPVTVSHSPDGWMLVAANGAEVQSREHYGAIALALNELPACVEWMRACVDLGGPAEVTRRAILARIDAAGFQMPKGE